MTSDHAEVLRYLAKEMDVDVLIFRHFHHPIIEESEVLLLSSGSAIVLDEPTTGQDWGHLNKFLARMKMLNEAGKTIILISHDMGVVAEYASRTIVMKDGGILMDASTREMFSRPDIRGRTVRIRSLKIKLKIKVMETDLTHFQKNLPLVTAYVALPNLYVLIIIIIIIITIT